MCEAKRTVLQAGNQNAARGERCKGRSGSACARKAVAAAVGGNARLHHAYRGAFSGGEWYRSHEELERMSAHSQPWHVTVGRGQRVCVCAARPGMLAWEVVGRGFVCWQGRTPPRRHRPAASPFKVQVVSPG